MKDYTFPDGTHLSDIRRIFPDAAIETMFAPDGGGGIEYAKIVFPPQPLPDRVVEWCKVSPVVFFQAGGGFFGAAVFTRITTGQETLHHPLDDASPDDSFVAAAGYAMRYADEIIDEIDGAGTHVMTYSTADGEVLKNSVIRILDDLKIRVTC